MSDFLGFSWLVGALFLGFGVVGLVCCGFRLVLGWYNCCFVGDGVFDWWAVFGCGISGWWLDLLAGVF